MIPRETQAPVDEGRLIREIRAGREELFEYFVRQYQRKITRIAYRFLRDEGEADCAAQESFLRAYQNLGDFREGAAFETWLTRICINWCKDRLKRRRLVVYFHQAPGGDGRGRRVVRRTPPRIRPPAPSAGRPARRSASGSARRSTRSRRASGRSSS